MVVKTFHTYSNYISYYISLSGRFTAIKVKKDAARPCPSGDEIKTKVECEKAAKYFAPDHPFSDDLKCDDPPNCRCFFGQRPLTGYTLFTNFPSDNLKNENWYAEVCRKC